MTYLEDIKETSHLWSDLVMRRQLHRHEEFEMLKGSASVYLEAQSSEGDKLSWTPVSKREHLHLSLATSAIGR